jgi:hypothetical protein
LPVTKVDDAIRHRGVVGIVRDHEHGLSAFFDQFSQKRHDAFTLNAVKVPRRLIRQDEKRLNDQGAGNGDALLFAAGEFMRAMLPAMGQSHASQHLGRPLARFVGGAAADGQRQSDVLFGRERI